MLNNFKYKWNSEHSDETDSTGTHTSDDNDDDKVPIDHGDDDEVQVPIKFCEISNNVNEITENVESISGQTEDTASQQGTIDGPNVPGNEPHESHELMPDQVPSNDVVEEVNEENSSVHSEISQTMEEPEEVVEDDNSNEPNNNEEATFNDDKTPTTTEGRYNLRAKSGVNYRHMHRYGEAQLMQIQQDWIKEEKSSKGGTSSKVTMDTMNLY